MIALLASRGAFAQADNPAADDTLAVVGSTAITAGEFAERYSQKILTVGLTDNGEARRQFLLNLVDDELLIAGAREEQLDRTRDARDELARIHTQVLLDRYVARHVRAGITVTESDLRELYVKANTRIKVGHLYSSTREGADSLLRALDAGKTFQELAMQVFTDPVLRRNGGDLGYITLDDMDPAFERAAYTMKVGEISGPVRTVRGYSILRVDDIKVNPLLNETEFLRARDNLQRFAMNRKLTEALRDASDSLRAELHLKFNHAVTERLFDVHQHSLSTVKPEEPWSELSPADMQETAVTTSRGTWSVRDLTMALYSIPERQRRWIRTEEDFEDVAAGALIRREVVRLARLEGLDRNDSYREEVRDRFDTYLLERAEERLKSGITITPDSLTSFYVQYQDRFMTPPDVRLSLILLDDRVMADSVGAMLRRGLPFGELAQRFSVQRNTAEHNGDAGYFAKTALGESGDRLFNLEIGSWTGPLAFEGKYLFALCTDRRPAQVRPFEEVSDEVRQALLMSCWFDVRRSAVESLKKKITWSIRPEMLAHMSLSSFNR